MLRQLGTREHSLRSPFYSRLTHALAVIFINSLFVSVINVSSVLPYMFRMRSVFYRERAAGMYLPEAHSLSHFIVEMPFILLLVFLVLTPICACGPRSVRDSSLSSFFLTLVAAVLSNFRLHGWLLPPRGRLLLLHFRRLHLRQCVVFTNSHTSHDLTFPSSPPP